MRLFRLLALPFLIATIVAAHGIVGGTPRAGGCPALRAEAMCIDPVILAQANALAAAADTCPAVLPTGHALQPPQQGGAIAGMSARTPAEGRPSPPPWRPPRALS